MRAPSYIITVVMCLVSFQLHASHAFGIRFGYGTNFFSPGMGHGLEPVKEEYDLDPGATYATGFNSPHLGLQYQYSFDNRQSIAVNGTVNWGQIKEAHGTSSEDDYYDGNLIVDFNTEEVDLLYSYRVLPWLIPFAGVKAITGFSSADLSVNTTVYGDGLPEGIPEKFTYVLAGIGPGGGIKTVTNMFGNLYFQTNFSSAFVYANSFYSPDNSTDSHSIDSTFILYNASVGFNYYIQSIRSSAALGASMHSFSSDDWGYSFPGGNLGNMGIVLSINHILI